MHPSEFTIGRRIVGAGHRAFVVAEVAQSHDGSLGQAFAFVDAAADAGADAIKFQTHIAAAESTPEEPFRVPLAGAQDRSRYDYWRRMEFSEEQWGRLRSHAADRDLYFLSTPFSLEAVELLERLDLPAWKIGSGEVNNGELLDACASTGKPVLLSSGLSGWNELEAAAKRVGGYGAPIGLFQCTSRYPTAMSDVGLNVLDEMSVRFGAPVGLSDHSGTPFPALAAMARGASLVEVHVTFHRKMFGPDVPASISFEELAFLTDARDAFFDMVTNPVKKDDIPAEFAKMRSLFNKSLALRTPLPAGSVLTSAVLTAKKPGSGIPASDKDIVIGKRLTRDVSGDRVLKWDDLASDPDD